MKSFALFGLTFTACLAALPTPSSLGSETQRQFLSGHGKDDAVPWRFFCSAGSQSGYWTNLPVPSNWEAHGFGTPNYSHDSTNAFNEQGRYQHEFTVPADWATRRVFLVFDGVMTDTHAELNGRPVGPDHQGSFYRFKYDVTALLQFNATNHLEVLVRKHSANASVNRAERQSDYWLFGGIFRPVYLEAVPPQFIERVAIDARADGAFALDVFAPTLTNPQPTLFLQAQITDLEGQPVGPPFAQALTGRHTTLKTQIRSPRQWTAETPNRYQVEVQLRNPTAVLHQIVQRFGFRTMEVREGDGLYVNGRRVILQGANRHSFWPDSGRCLSEAVHRQDIALMKDMNFNAVRMSHYPPDEQFLDLCDELGLYVLDELGGWQACYDTPTGRKLIEEMVTRDVNHPCILFWDNGNEGGWNTELDAEFARWDPQQRRVLHPWTTFSGVNTAHYLTYSRVQEACAGTPSFRRKDYSDLVVKTNPLPVIYMPTEFLHGLYDGGAGAGLEDHWTLMRQSKTLGGGFIWALVDEGFLRRDTGKLDLDGNRAPDGIVGPYREKEASFYTTKELWSPIVVREGKRAAAGITLSVENRYSFTDANQCRFVWQLRRFPLLNQPLADFAVLEEGKARVPSIPPGQTGTLKLSLPNRWQQADALALQVKDPNGRELWTWVWPLAGASRCRQLVATPSRQPVSALENNEAIEIKTGELVMRISTKTGLLLNVQRGTQTFSLANGPRAAAGTATLTGIDKRAEGDDYLVTASFDGSLRSITWRVRGNGWIQCAYTYTANGPQDFHGVLFDYPESLVTHKKWLGDGPYRVWKNRLRGVSLNVWENDYNNTITGWSDWVYPEFKGCFANVRWLQLDTKEGLITAVPERDDQFVQVLTPDLPPANLQAKTALNLPRAGLAFLQAIPPIGNKFHAPKDVGPQAYPTIALGHYSGAVDLYFGPLPGN